MDAAGEPTEGLLLVLLLLLFVYEIDDELYLFNGYFSRCVYIDFLPTNDVLVVVAADPTLLLYIVESRAELCEFGDVYVP